MAAIAILKVGLGKGRPQQEEQQQHRQHDK